MILLTTRRAESILTKVAATNSRDSVSTSSINNLLLANIPAIMCLILPRSRKPPSFRSRIKLVGYVLLRRRLNLLFLPHINCVKVRKNVEIKISLFKIKSVEFSCISSRVGKGLLLLSRKVKMEN